MTTDSANALNEQIVSHSRKARFAGVSTDEWAERLAKFIALQADVIGPVEIFDVKPVESAAGGSNGTLLFKASFKTGESLQTVKLVLRFNPAEGLFHKYDLDAQVRIQKGLATCGVPVPGQRWIDPEGETLGVPAYIMDQVDGVSTPMTWKASGIIADAAPAQRAEMIRNYLAALGSVHAADWRKAGLEFLEQRAFGSRPIEREVNWYWDAVVWAGLGDELSDLAAIRTWLIKNEPRIDRPVLCHGDSNLGNYLYVGTTVSAIVDWEMAFLGAPECDLAFMIEGAETIPSPTPEGVPTPDGLKAEYEHLTGHKLAHWDYYRLFALYRIAVITSLAKRHFPKEFLVAFEPVFVRTLERTREIARAAGVPT